MDTPPSVTCPSCGRQNPHGFRFCGSCGTLLEEAANGLREERKRVSVLFCDLVGFTGRAETMDPEEVRALLQPYHSRVRHELERHGGTVEKFIGDAVVALFGAPVAHEDDPERAVRAALAIRDTVAGEALHVRIGVTTGEALVALEARPDRGEGMASGDVVNTAARLQAAAPVDGVLVDEATYRSTQRVIDYREHPPIEAKGKVEPVHVREAVSARSRFGLDVGERTSTPLVGRQLELEQLATALARARAERSVQLVTLVGVPGIGKSRLLLELFRRVEEDPELIQWRQGRCLPYGEGVTLWALGEIVKAQAGVLETDSADEAEEKIRTTVRDSVADDGEARWVERHLRPLVGLEVSDELTGDRRDEAFAAWRRYFEGIAEHGPLVLVVEDLQWADDTLLDFLDHLVDWATDIPLLVVATARPELLARRPNWGGGKANALIQSLAPLSDDETAALVHAILGRSVLPADVQRSLVSNAGGNPLYAEEFAHMLGERSGDGEDARLPDSVQGIIAARLDSLEPAEKGLLQDAAVLGKVFWLAALEALTGEERWRLEQRLHELERRELVRRDRHSAVAGERQYAFRHLLLREVAYGQIPRARRAAKHEAAARWIEGLAPDRSEDRAEMLVHHWSSALRYAGVAGLAIAGLEAAARDALVESGDRALNLNAPAEAVGFYERALALGASDEVRLRYGRSLYLAGDDRAGQVLGEARGALSSAGDKAGESFAEAMLNHVAWLAGNQDESIRHITRAVELVRELPASERKAYVLARAASRAYVANRLEEAVAFGSEALAIAEELGLDDVLIHALTTVGDARDLLGDAQGQRDLARALDLAVAANSPEAGRTAHNLGVMAFLHGDIARSGELQAQAVRLEQRFGNAAMLRFTTGMAASLAYFIGEWDEAVRVADAFIAECETAPHYMEPHARAFRAIVRFGRDDVDGALADLDRAFSLLDVDADPQARGAPLGVAGRILLELADPRAVRTATEALELHFGSLPEPVTITLLPTADLPVEVKDRVEAVLAATDSDAAWVAGARAAFAHRFDEAAAIYARMPYKPAEAHVHLRAAEILVADGRRAEADEHLHRAIGLWRSMGATRYLRQAEALLAATA